jgi:hypothetical protein
VRVQLDEGNVFSFSGRQETNDCISVLGGINSGLPEPIILVAFLAVKTLKLLAEIFDGILTTLLKI